MFLVCLSSENSGCCDLTHREDKGEVLNPRAGLGVLWSPLSSRLFQGKIRSGWGSEDRGKCSLERVIRLAGVW